MDYQTQITSADSTAAETKSKNKVESLSTEHADHYPPPPGKAAYHGLAGEVVGLIEPHTEADPVALLFQLLAAFGNTIGHGPHILADGASHGMKLFGVLVGNSSKGRKGTSWNQIARLLERIDPDWRRDCTTSGLSTGEGLIWAVRDPVTEMRLVKYAGGGTGYEPVIVDEGAADKRLFLVEGEFSNLLKVMRRETNTLSAVIRNAWDHGNLRTMTKTRPTRATNAHVSIVGHITRPELRRLLSATDGANGFANRFCWLAVERSKYLPEGGQIDAVNFEPLLLRLQAAIEFSRRVGEVKRGDAARELWRADYAGLSDGKPGMLGAVTGRAEAQVMRLSAIYALLDESALILPVHHHAAMAFWRYCEESSRWIFGTATGDKNADHILSALKIAGEQGMTKTEISEQVFRRHLLSEALSEALQILRQAKLAGCRKEATGGAPSERWVALGEVAN